MAAAHACGQVDDALDQRRGHEGAGAAVTLDGPEGLRGVESRHDDDGAAQHVGEQREAPRRRVVHGAGDEVDVARVREIEGLHESQHDRRIHRAAERALGLPGSASRVDHRAAEGRACRCRRRVRAAALHEVVEVQRPGPPRLAHEDPVPHLQSARAQLLDHGDERVVGEGDHAVGVVEDVGDLLGHQPVIHRDGDGPQRPGARGSEQAPRESCGRTTTFSPAENQPGQRMRQAIAPIRNSAQVRRARPR